LEPAPERERKTTWKEFPCRHREVIAAADFFTVEAWTRNAHAERSVRSIKESCLERWILFGEGCVRKAIREFVLHYHHDRNHQGQDNRLIIQEQLVADRAAASQRRSRLGGMLNYYHRQAA
jgi:hypothetical protein